MIDSVFYNCQPLLDGEKQQAIFKYNNYSEYDLEVVYGLDTQSPKYAEYAGCFIF